MAEVNMAYGELIILRKELSNLSHILHKIVDIKKFQAKLFIKKVGEVMRILEMEGTPCFPDQLVEDVVTLAEPPIEDFVQEKLALWMVEYHIPKFYDNNIMSTEYRSGEKSEREVPKIVEQIGLIENKLAKFLDETDLYNNWKDLRNNLVVLLPSREAVRNLLQSSQELIKAMNFFHQTCTETGVLCECLRVLCGFFSTISREKFDCSTELIEGIRDVVNNALNATGYPEQDRLLSHFVNLENVLSGFPATSLMKNRIEKMTKELFDGKKGMRLVFLETLGKLLSFLRKVDIMTLEKPGREDYLQSWNNKLGREDIQSWNASIGSLHPKTYCRLVFPISRENKGRRLFREKTYLNIFNRKVK
ncbi:hypothetical protein ACH5RR_030090 [Cinchona calisaya]|uniref:Uncharacterized protein n=1 Tax=Cinchona calisaya TaxID=153742 RepID=A0ABD2YTK7_9GENT